MELLRFDEVESPFCRPQFYLLGVYCIGIMYGTVYLSTKYTAVQYLVFHRLSVHLQNTKVTLHKVYKESSETTRNH